MKVSFDFDGTLERPIIQQMAKKHINAGDEVFIITRRCPEDSDDVYSVASKLGIPNDKCLFTCKEWKWRTIGDLGIDLHYEDKLIEAVLIERNTKTKVKIV